jgi:lactoylglutathione lyase
MHHIKSAHAILYVSNQALSCRFYQRIFRMEPDLNVPGITEFHLFDNCIIGLMPNDGIARILANNTPHPGSGTGIP